MELPLSAPRAHAAAAFSCSPTYISRLQWAATSHSRARPLHARRNKNSRGDAAEPKVITIGRPGKKSKRRGDKKQDQQQLSADQEDEDDDEEEDEEEDERDVAIPEVVTNRMMRRVGASVGLPLALGLAFFPAFYYLKKVAKVDVPSFIPYGLSFVFFGAALAGVSYGIVSASWDPAREGSLLGWNEARRNWPVFWESFRGTPPPPGPPRRGR
ncbi:protein PAM68, chloroplastic-like [Hordeum vulgare]|nr:protein PAM68, chloroplastic-like [Hordeum vulgare]